MTVGGINATPLQSDNRERRKLAPKDNLTRCFQKLIQHCAVNAAEVRIEFQIAVVEIDKARVLAEQSRFYRAAKHKHRSSRTVIGAAIRIFLNEPAKFAEGHEQYAVEISLLFEIGDEGGKRVIDLAHQAFVRVDLTSVRIEPALARVINSRRQSARDHACDDVQARSKLTCGIWHGRFVFAGDCENFVGA